MNFVSSLAIQTINLIIAEGINPTAINAKKFGKKEVKISIEKFSRSPYKYAKSIQIIIQRVYIIASGISDHFNCFCSSMSWCKKWDLIVAICSRSFDPF